MILTDREIKIAIERDLITVTPTPADTAFSSSSVDLTLDARLSVFNDQQPGMEQVIDPGRTGFNHDAALASITTQTDIPADGWVFDPGHLVLAWTQQYVDLKTDTRIAARVEGKSSLARLGIGVHVTAPTIHAGFSGQIRLEMINHGKFPVRLRTGMKICQLILESTLGTPERGYRGRFSNQDANRRG